MIYDPAIINKIIFQYNEGLSIKDISENVSIPKSTIRSILLREQVKLRPKPSRVDLSKEDEVSVIQDYAEGLSKQAIASKYHIPINCIERLFRSRGLTFRSNAGYIDPNAVTVSQLVECYYGKKMNLQTIGRLYNLHPTTIREKLLRHNYVLRKNINTYGKQFIINGHTLRSAWEAAFYILNQHCVEYEHTVLYYMYNNRQRKYITDFTDLSKRIIYEIKPKFKLSDDIIQAKIAAAKDWCNSHGYTYSIITEDFFLSLTEEEVNQLRGYDGRIIDSMKAIGVKCSSLLVESDLLAD